MCVCVCVWCVCVLEFNSGTILFFLLASAPVYDGEPAFEVSLGELVSYSSIYYSSACLFV